MVATKTIEKTYNNVNLVNKQTAQLYLSRVDNPKESVFNYFANEDLIHWSKYQIVEEDRRIKTATIETPQYVDLTTGVYLIRIISPYHPNFTGVIIDVESDKVGQYTYKLQDLSRFYQGKTSFVFNNVKLHRALKTLLTRGDIKITDKKYNSNHVNLKGLRPAWKYHQGLWGNGTNFNPMTKKLKMIIRDTNYIEAIRDLVYGTGAYIDVYVDNKGVIQIVPFNKDDWIQSGFYITTPEIAKQKVNFDLTNVITRVTVDSGEGFDVGYTWNSKQILGLDLELFFGRLGASVSDKDAVTTKTTTKTFKTSTNKINGTPVHVNMDNIVNSTKDKATLNEIKKQLTNKGYKVTTGGINPNAHYKEINKVKKNGIYFTVYGGRCASTLKEQCYSSHYHNVLKKKNAKMVIGFIGKKLTDAYLGRAHDDNFSSSGFKGWDKPRTRLLNAGIGIAQGNNVKELIASFPGFKNDKNNTKTTTTKKTIFETITNLNYVKDLARNKMVEQIHDFLNMNITVPLGNPLFKDLHTNMFIYTELPYNFILENFDNIVDVMGSVESNYIKYQVDRWYVEKVTINNDGKTFDADISLNPFGSSYRSYKDDKLKFIEAFNRANNQSNKQNTTTTSNKSKSNNETILKKRSDGKGQCSDTYYLATKSGRNNIKNLLNKSESKLAQGTIGKTGTNYHKFVKKCTTAKQIYQKLAGKIPQKVAGYWNCKYKCAEDAFKHLNNLNCAERARLYKACCDVQGIPCVIYHVEGHYLNGVKVNGKWKTADLCYRAGITHKEYNGAGFNK